MAQRKKRGRSSVNKSWKKGHQISATPKSKRCPKAFSNLTLHNSSIFLETRARAEFSDGHGARQPHFLPPPPSIPGHPRPGAASPPTNGIHGSQVSVPPPAQPFPPFPPCLPPFPSAPPLNPPVSRIFHAPLPSSTSLRLSSEPADFHPARSTLSLLDVISILHRRENPFTTTFTLPPTQT